jgi:hypothetical protein
MGMRDKLRDAKQELLMKQGVPQADMPQVTSADTSKALNTVGLDVGQYSAEEIRYYNAQSIKKIRQEMRGNGLIKAGITFGGSATERATLSYLSALVEQNWVLMRQNELMISSLEKLAEKRQPEL